MSDIKGQTGICINCDGAGSVGSACGERACRKRGYRYIPVEFAARHEGETDTEALIGRTIGDYLVVDVIGVGGFGKVYLAFQLPIMMRAALKLMERAKFDRSVMKLMVKQFEGEAAALAALNHPNIVRLLKYGMHASMPYLVMEYVADAKTFKREIANRAVRGEEFKPEEVHSILAQIVAGLEAAHMLEIVHRDIKPDNIMLQSLPGHHQFVRILDFGMAKFVQDTHDTKFAMGTPAYMAPEQLTRKGIGPWTDLYAVGVMTYELLSGKRPFTGRTHQELLAKKLDEGYDPVSRLAGLPLPDIVRSFLSKALAFDPEERYRDAASFRQGLAQVFEALARSPSDTTLSVELSELVDSSADVERLKKQQKKLEQERDRLAEEKRRFEEERRQLNARRRTMESSPGPTSPSPPALPGSKPKRRGPSKSASPVPPRPPPTEASASGLDWMRETDPDKLQRRIERLEAAERWPEVIEVKQRLIEVTTKPLEKFMLQMSIGDIHRTRLGYTQAAADAYEQALAYGTYSKAPLLHLVQISTDAKNYERAVGYLERLVEAEQSPRKKAVYAQSIGVLYRDALEDVSNAVKYLNMALDLDPGKVKAFRAIEEMLSRAGEWAALGKAYERMIVRVRKTSGHYENPTSVLFVLYKSLGRVLLEKLEAPERALQAYEAAHKLRGADEFVREQLLMLYEEQGLGAQAAEQYRLRLKVHQHDYPSYTALARLYQNMGEVDRAWLVCGLLCAWGREGPEERDYYVENVAPLELDVGPFDEEIWGQLVVGPPESPRLGQALGVIWDTLGRHLETSTAKEYGLRRRDKSITLRGHFHDVATRVCRCLGLPLPEIYLDHQMRGVQVLPVMPLALKVGPDVLHMQDRRRLAFVLAKYVTMLHPWHVMGALYDDEQLAVLLLAAKSLVSTDGRLYLPDDLPVASRDAYTQQVLGIRQELEARIEPLMRVKLARLMPGIMERSELPDIAAWRALVELTSNHAATVITDDVAMAADVLRSEPAGTSRLETDEKMRDLVLWVLSNRFQEIRARLGQRLVPAN